VGVIYGKMGRAYMVQIKDGGKIKKIVAGPEHLKVVR
jgi:ribosomal protein L21E